MPPPVCVMLNPSRVSRSSRGPLRVLRAAAAALGQVILLEGAIRPLVVRLSPSPRMAASSCGSCLNLSFRPCHSAPQSSPPPMLPLHSELRLHNRHSPPRGEGGLNAQRARSLAAAVYKCTHHECLSASKSVVTQQRTLV